MVTAVRGHGTCGSVVHVGLGVVVLGRTHVVVV